MPLNAASDGNFHTRIQEEAERLIENLAACSSSMDTDLKRRESIAALWREDMDAVKIKLDSVYKILKNQNSLRKNAETSDTRGYKKDFRHVDFIRGFNNSSYQKSPAETEESRIEVRFDQVLESQEC